MKAILRSMPCYGFWLCSLALVSVFLSTNAQTLPVGPDIRSGRSGLEEILGGRRPVTPTGDMFFEGVIDPDEYFVGPGDRLNLVFWQPTYTENPITVSGDGDVIIPYVGVVPVGGVSLTEARRRIETAVTQNLRVGRATVSLVQPRQFRVHVTGLVEYPGSYIVPATARVADAIFLAGGLEHDVSPDNLDSTIAEDVSQRRVELLDRTGKLTGYADLLLFRQSGDVRRNPLLRDGQVIRVPYKAGPALQISVAGAVNQSGSFEYAPDDHLRDALALAGGLTANADSSAIRIVGRAGGEATVDLRAAEADAALAPGDRILVPGSPDTSRAGAVTLRGEVAQPGGYPIVSGQTTVREVLDRAGGLLPTAAAGSARLIRGNAQDMIRPERQRILESGNLTSPTPALPSDPALAAEFARWDYGPVVLDLTEDAPEGSRAEDVTLRDGDVLEIPRQPIGVRVLGFVNHAGEVEWRPGENLNYYLSEAGGTNRGGWKRQAVLIKARNGSQVRYDPGLAIDPGDVIYVPAKPRTTTWQTVQDIVAVTAQLVTLVLVIQNIGQ